MKRTSAFIALILISLLALTVIPVSAQTNLSIEPVDWIPADFAAYIRIDMSDPGSAAQVMNLGVFTTALFQPTRATWTTPLTFNNFFPLTGILDMEDASFEQDILPWLNGSAILAYRDIDRRFITRQDDVLLMLPVSDSFQAATYLQRVIAGQDLLQRETYRGLTVYLGDQTAFVITPQAILIGSRQLVRDTLDVRAGESAALTSDPLYLTIHETIAESETDAVLSAYLSRESAQNAFGFLIGGGESNAPLLMTLGNSLSTYMDRNTAQSLLLSGGVDGIGIHIFNDLETGAVSARVILHTEQEIGASVEIDPAVLDMIPRSAIIVQSGGDAADVLRTGLVALPMASFAGTILSAFPVNESVGAASGIVTPPTSDEIVTALQGFTDTLEPIVNLDEDIFQNLTGSYAMALIPRPNNPLPVLNSNVDVLFVAQTADAEQAQATVENLTTLIETFSDTFSEESVNDQTVYNLNVPQTDETLVSIGIVDNTIVIGTGDSTRRALAAMRGDNRLINQERWQGVAENGAPTTYIDAGALINLILPTEGASPQDIFRQMGITSHALSPDLIELEVLLLLN